jgi:hypothetical protein
MLKKLHDLKEQMLKKLHDLKEQMLEKLQDLKEQMQKKLCDSKEQTLKKHICEGWNLFCVTIFIYLYHTTWKGVRVHNESLM